jgi:hypothetical protein
MNPYAPPKAAENIMNERIAPVSQRWRRVKWRMRNLIRKNRRIANTPGIAVIAIASRGRHFETAARAC